jgi:hypothetical protein
MADRQYTIIWFDQIFAQQPRHEQCCRPKR